MHMVILAIVEADNEEDAVGEAQNVFDGLCGDDKPFDYYVTFDKDGGVGHGNQRWGNLPAAAKADSEEGKKLIGDAMKSTKDEFFSNLKGIREVLLCFTDEEIFEQSVSDNKTKMLMALTEDKGKLRSQLHSVKYKMLCCGEYRGPSIWLYTREGEGIRNEEDLKSCLDEIAKGRAWVVPADVHH